MKFLDVFFKVVFSLTTVLGVVCMFCMNTNMQQLSCMFVLTCMSALAVLICMDADTEVQE